MNAFVNSQILGSRKILLADVTFERLLPGVDSHVVGQLVFRLEGLLLPRTTIPKAVVLRVAIA